MLQVEFFEWTLSIDVARTNAAYVHVDLIDAAHCESCMAFVRALDLNLIPEPIITLLRQAGADPYRLHELWGAPDGGFLAGSWFLIGKVLRGEWIGGTEGASVELAAGLQCWINGRPTLPPPDVMRGEELVELEFTWENPIVATLIP